MKHQKFINTAIVVCSLFSTIAACQKEPGSAEKAGKAVDNATEKAGQQIEKAGQDIQDATKGNKK
jgi:hypothetical protein